ncbi:MAG: hypothetical protein GTO63_30750 [Anaerolineae bacterium]|nr:hypothetical protein [Anaerolineae bacterium]NIN99076.1 hypothetical protein [Anaerolineae bacterium]NIQ81924.1 hypothetical protein [Anaerolineae bacterium]
MSRTRSKARIRYYVLAILCVAMLIAPGSVMARPLAAPPTEGPWWETVPEAEVPSPGYDSILYSEIAPKLREIEVNSNRVKVEVMGQSAGGRNLFLVTVSAPEAMGRLGQYQAIRQTMLKDPERAQEMVDEFGDFKVPFYIHGSVHGDEYPGVDAAIRLIETLAYDDSEEVQMILDNVILLVNVVANPDGRVMGIRHNANGFDLNRDFITLSQPETRATVRVFTEWNPMVVLDLHGFIDPMLIEPCTPPHNPNYEYDLYIQWAYDQALAMEAELFAQEGLEALIPIRDWPDGWDDWPPIFTPMYAMYHGAYGHTLETPLDTDTGVAAHYAAVWGALKFVSENRAWMIRDQIEIFRRGFLDLPQLAIPQEILDEIEWDQYNHLTTIDFPTAYVIPAEAPLQQSPHEAARLVDLLIFNDVQVERADRAFTLDGVDYPRGTYIVWMDQPKRGLANTILWAGWDISYDPGLTMYDISGWSHPLLWGVSQAVMEERMDVRTHPVTGADEPQGSVVGQRMRAYAYLPTSNAAIKATNDLLARGIEVYRAEEPFTASGHEFGVGTFILQAGQGQAMSIANELASQYGLDVFAVDGPPEGATLMYEQQIALFDTGPGVGFALKELGFDCDMLYKSDLDEGMDLTGYDVFIDDWWWWEDLGPEGQASFEAFLDGGGDYIGIGPEGIYFAYGANLLDFDYEIGHPWYYWSHNGVLNIDYDPTDLVAAQYPADSHGFIYGSVWFTSLGPGIDVSASIDGGAFFVSGYWPGWDTIGAAGQPIVVHGTVDSSEVTLMGINPTFRAHPEHTFRILANAIYNGLE